MVLCSFDQFIKAQIKSGRFGNASEVVRASLRRMEEDEQKLEALRRALAEGENSGQSTPLDMEDIRKTAKKQVALND